MSHLSSVLAGKKNSRCYKMVCRILYFVDSKVKALAHSTAARLQGVRRVAHEVDLAGCGNFSVLKTLPGCGNSSLRLGWAHC